MKSPWEVPWLRRSLQVAAGVLALAVPHAAWAHDWVTDPDDHEPGYTPDFEAIKSGPWSEDETWSGTGVPGDGHCVYIPDPFIVDFDLDMQSGSVPLIEVEGTLRFPVAASTTLRVETLFLDGGALLCGTSTTDFLDEDEKLTIVFTNDGDPVSSSIIHEEMGRGLLGVAAVVELFGAPKQKSAVLASDAHATDDSLSLVGGVPADWRADDSLVVAPTDFARGEQIMDDRRTIETLSPFQLDSGLEFDHLRIPNANGQTYLFDVHVVNLTRNITLTSDVDALPDLDLSDPQNATALAARAQAVALRGHVMLMSGGADADEDGHGDDKGSAELFNVAFVRLGRTDKMIPLDDHDEANRRGRYSLHFHRLGPNDTDSVLVPEDPVFNVRNCVVDETPGWGFTNHSSYVRFEDCVAYDYDGAGFATESGDEIGFFKNNIAVRGNGDGEIRKIRIAWAADERFDNFFFDKGDMGFTGDGFWFQGPCIVSEGNVAAGNKGSGMVYHNTGLVEDRNGPDTAGGLHYVGIPINVFRDFYEQNDFLDKNNDDENDVTPRRWIEDHLLGFDNPCVVADIPILKCTGFRAYANLTGFKIRWTNHASTILYDEGNQHAKMTAASKANVARIRQKIDDMDLWNNEQGMHVRYTDKTDLFDVRIVNRLTHDRPGWQDGDDNREDEGEDEGPPPEPGHAQALLTGDTYDWPIFGAGLEQASIHAIEIKDFVVDGYPVAAWQWDHNSNNSSAVNFTGSKSYFNHALGAKMLGKDLNMAVTLTANTITSTGFKVNWTNGNNPASYFIRWRVKPDTGRLVYWNYIVPSAVDATTNETFSGLTTDTKYEVQLMYFKNDVPSCWSNVLEVETL